MLMTAGLNDWGRARGSHLLQEYSELAGILSQADMEELENDPDPVSVASGKITEYLYQCAHGTAQTPPPIYSTLDNNIKGLNADLGACQRILSKPCGLC